MSTASNPLLPIQISGVHDADIDDTDPAQTAAARERRFRWVRLAVLATAGAKQFKRADQMLCPGVA